MASIASDAEQMQGSNPYSSLLLPGKRSRQEPNGADDLLHYFRLDKLSQMARKQPPSKFFSRVAGDVNMYKGDAWRLAPVVDWPNHTFTYQDVSPQQIRDAFSFQPGPSCLDAAAKGQLVLPPAPPAPEPAKPSEQRGGASADGAGEKKPTVALRFKISTRRPAGSGSQG